MNKFNRKFLFGLLAGILLCCAPEAWGMKLEAPYVVADNVYPFCDAKTRLQCRLVCWYFCNEFTLYTKNSPVETKTVDVSTIGDDAEEKKFSEFLGRVNCVVKAVVDGEKMLSSAQKHCAILRRFFDRQKVKDSLAELKIILCRDHRDSSNVINIFFINRFFTSYPWDSLKKLNSLCLCNTTSPWTCSRSELFFCELLRKFKTIKKLKLDLKNVVVRCLGTITSINESNVKELSTCFLSDSSKFNSSVFCQAYFLFLYPKIKKLKVKSADFTQENLALLAFDTVTCLEEIRFDMCDFQVNLGECRFLNVLLGRSRMLQKIVFSECRGKCSTRRNARSDDFVRGRLMFRGLQDQFPKIKMEWITH